MSGEPTLGEVMRRLDEIATRVDRTSARQEEFRNWAERLYVPRAEWVEGRRADQLAVRNVESDVNEIKADQKSDAGFRRTVLAMFAVAAFSGILSAAIAVATLVLGK